MSNLTPERCARALELRNVWAVAMGGSSAETLSIGGYRPWLAVEKHILESHKPEWRPTTGDEIQVGWEVRSRYESGHEATWGTAHYQDYDGGWRTKSNVLLTAAGWTYETTAPLPEPEPDQRIELLAKELHKESECKELWPCAPTADSYRERARRLLAKFDELKNDNTNNN